MKTQFNKELCYRNKIEITMQINKGMAKLARSFLFSTTWRKSHFPIFENPLRDILQKCLQGKHPYNPLNSIVDTGYTIIVIVSKKDFVSIWDEVLSYNYYITPPSYNRSLPDQRYDQTPAYSFSRIFLCRSFLAKTYSGYRQSRPSLVPSAADHFAIQQ